MSEPIDAPTWDLDRFFAGGPGGEIFTRALGRMREALSGLLDRADALGPLPGDPEGWSALLRDLVDATEALAQLGSFAYCAYAADTASKEARLAQSATDELGVRLARAWVPIKAGLGEASEADVEAVVARPELADLAPLARQLRVESRLELERPLQALLVELDREALHGWGQLYDLVSGRLEARLEVPGEAPRTVGIAALEPLRSHPEERFRRAAHEAARRSWHGVRDICAMALTHITGARQTRFDRAGIDELDPSLVGNRISRRALEAMDAARDAAGPVLRRAIARKARLLGTEGLDWWDQGAPYPADAAASFTWEGARDLITESFARFSPAMAAFAARALEDRWIDGQMRDGKRQGGFCSGFPRSAESRILMTFGGTLDNVLTLAHELGHAYHNHLLFELPPARRRVPYALAETASTFAEAIVRDRAFEEAASRAVRLRMLDQRLQAGVSFLMNIPARFRFERELYRMRRRGAFDPDALGETMVRCQEEAYGGALASYSPLFWASKLHFYISHFGFYNWPYMFGYLFSGAVYARAGQEGTAFVPRYEALLKLTGYEETEALARQALGERLSDPGFWERATGPLRAAADAFLEATRDGEGGETGSDPRHPEDPRAAAGPSCRPDGAGRP